LSGKRYTMATWYTKNINNRIAWHPAPDAL
jgi:hypothetical protein